MTFVNFAFVRVFFSIKNLFTTYYYYYYYYYYYWGKGGNVTSAGWQVTLCDPM